MKKTAIIAWGLALLITVVVVAQVFQSILNLSPDQDFLTNANDFLFLLVLPFPVVAALIVSRQPRNVIGWLLFLPAIALLFNVEPYIRSFAVLPPNPPLRLVLSAWVQGWGWLFVIFPLFFIALLYPTGRPPSPRWRWLVYFGIGLCLVFFFLVTFQNTFNMTDFGANWSLPDPIGFIPLDEYQGIFFILWGAGLFSMAVLSVASLFVRYRSASLVEREQIKWLLYACVLFAVFYMAAFPFNLEQWGVTNLSQIANLFWALSMIGIPVSIGIAILRYRLWDIDVLIRRTLIYGALTLTLALVFLGAVTLLQAVFSAVSGQRSAVATVISTLLIAALFSPLLRRIQNDIDRRFYRKKYNAEQAIERFAATARQETDLEALSAELLAVVAETMQPERVTLWIRPTASPRAGGI